MQQTWQGRLNAYDFDDDLIHNLQNHVNGFLLGFKSARNNYIDTIEKNELDQVPFLFLVWFDRCTNVHVCIHTLLSIY